MYFSDGLTLDAPRRTSDGYMAVRARAARIGVYHYSGLEVDPDNAHGLRDQATVNVLRDAEQVFDRTSLASFVGKPITDDHPSVSVNAANWRDHARGVIMGAVKDGDHVGFDLAFLDAGTIAKVDSGKVELSNGYNSELEFGPFTAADGTVCQARQTSITGNHIALVDRGRAGSTCRVTDAAPCASAPQSILDSLTQEKPVPKIMTIDGLSVDIANADVAASTIDTLLAARDAATARVAAADAKVVERDATIVARDAEIVALKAKVEDAKLTPAQMRDAGKAYAIVCGKAQAMGVAVTDAMDEGAIMKAVVDKAMPGNTYTGDHVGIAFAALTKDAKVADADPLRDAIQGQPIVLSDARAARDAALLTANEERRNAHKGSN